MLPSAFDLDRTLEDVAWLVDEVGPRPAGSPAARRVEAAVARKLALAGWSPLRVGLDGNTVACRGRGGRLLLAHTDSVPGSPGAADNGVAVAILLELARTSEAPDLCLGFPVREEVDLAGSRALAADRRWHPAGETLGLVVSTELLGQGELTVMGLGAGWGTDRLRWLTERVEVATPLAYRVYSRLVPDMERSDHAPFLGSVPAILLMGRGEHGVYPHYHQPPDVGRDPEAIRAAASALEALARGPLPPQASPSPLADPALPWYGHVLPGWAVWSLVAGGIGAGLAHWRRWRGLAGQAWRGGVAALAAGLVMVPFTSLGWFPAATEEQTAARTTGMPATGWWAGAPLALAAALATFLAVRHLLRPRGSAPLAAALVAALAATREPLVALPFALAAVLAHLHPLFALLGPAHLLRPDALREFSFHGLFPPWTWGLVWLLAWAAVGSKGEKLAAPFPAPRMPGGRPTSPR